MAELDLENGGLKIEKAIAENGEIICCSTGVSMYPMLRSRRDMVVISKLDRKLKKYDVPLYRVPSGKLFLHRIIKITDKGYVIRGDNRFNNEYNITDDMIIGVLKAFYREGKFYDCATHKGYKLYIRLNRYTFYLRKLWSLHLRPFLSKVKRFVLGGNRNGAFR